MHKTTLEVDEALCERARRVLGTRGLKATVQRAFEEVLALDARRRAIRQLQELDGLDLDHPRVMAEAWRTPSGLSRGRLWPRSQRAAVARSH